MSAVQAKKINIVQAINMALHDAMELDSSVVVLGEDIADREGGGVFKCTAGLSTRFGTGRVNSTPIAEQAIVGAAVGGALAGLRPVAEIMLMNFTTVAMDQIVNHAAKLRFMTGGQTHVPLVIRTTTLALSVDGSGSVRRVQSEVEGPAKKLVQAPYRLKSQLRYCAGGRCPVIHPAAASPEGGSARTPAPALYPQRGILSGRRAITRSLPPAVRPRGPPCPRSPARRPSPSRRCR